MQKISLFCIVLGEKLANRTYLATSHKNQLVESEFLESMALSLQKTKDRFAKSTQHLISHFSKQFGSDSNKNGADDTELSEEENAIRCRINFERLLHKTLEFVKKSDEIIQNPHSPPLSVRIDENYRSLQFDFDEHLMNEHQSKMNVIKNWQMNRRQGEFEKNSNDLNDCQQNKLNEQMIKKCDFKKKHWKLRKRRRIMRFSEKLSKEREQKESEPQNVKKNELNQREQLVAELEQMTKLLKKGVISLSKTLKNDSRAMNDLDEETHASLDRVSGLNERLSKYVQSTSGMTCTMCLMMATVIMTWIWCFTLIYFI